MKKLKSVKATAVIRKRLTPASQEEASNLGFKLRSERDQAFKIE